MSKVKKYTPRVLSAVLSVMIMCGCVGAASYSAGAQNTIQAKEAEAETSVKETESKTNGGDITKEETVYVIADAEGNAEKVIVSDWIKNSGGKNTISDITNLTDIKNVKGDETYTLNKDGACVWDADGNDIYYQGTGKTDLPVELELSYKLNGKKIAAGELAGKSGKVTIRIEYTNNEYENIKLDGKEEKIYVPFVVLTGMILDNDNFRNVEVSNGKIINDGDRTYVAGFGAPGMQESLDIDKEDLEIPEYVEITADTTDFELATTLTLATNQLFNGVDFTDVDDTADGLSDSLSELTEATDKLIDGSSELYGGVSTLLDKSVDLIDGVNQLNEGAQQLESGAKTLDSGASSLYSGAGSLDSGASSLASGAGDLDSGVSALQGYISELAGGLNTISENSKSLNQGAEQVFESLLSTADAQIAAAGLTAEKLTIENYGKVLNGVAASLDEKSVKELAYNMALGTVTQTVNAQSDIIRQAVESQVRKQITESVLSGAGYSMSAEDYDSAVAAGQIPEDAQAQISAAVSAQMSSDSIQGAISANTQTQIDSLIEENMQSEQVQSQITSAVEQAKAGKKSISALKAQLDSYNEFYQGVLAYTAGVDSANAGAKQILSGTGALKSGASKLKSGAGELKDGTSSLFSGAGELKSGASSLVSGTGELAEGISSLKDGGGALVDGVKQLADGSMTLTDGLKQYRDEGVQVLVDAVDGDVKGLINRLKAVCGVSENYKSYSGISEDMDGSVSFIYRTDAIETE